MICGVILVTLYHGMTWGLPVRVGLTGTGKMRARVTSRDDGFPGRPESEITYCVRSTSMAEKSSEFERLAALNAARERERAVSLSLEESARLFEELCSLFHAEFEGASSRKEHPFGLIKYWKEP